MSQFAPFFKTVNVPWDLFLSNEVIFTEAFTHRSAVNDKTKLSVHNERLEFLGDAVLELVTTDYLYQKFMEKPEGELTNLRSALVKKEHLAMVARRLGIGDLLRMSKGEDRSGGRDKDYLLANTLEAFIGALYITTGMEESKPFIESFILADTDKILASEAHIDAKSKFQELTQGRYGITPQYKVLAESGKDHEKHFELGAYLDSTLVGVGTGGSKKEAQVDAAENALSKLNEWESKFKTKT